MFTIFIVLLVLFNFSSASSEAAQDSDLHIYFLAVGQGDAAVVLCEGYAMIIDGGDSQHSAYIYSFLHNTIEINHIDVMIASHPHMDHVGGLAAALNACYVDLIYSPVLDYDTKAWNPVKKYAEIQGTPIVVPDAGDEFDLGELHVQILGPLHCYADINNMSLIIKITFGNTSFLFTGDAEWEAEHDLLNAGVDLSADVLKVGHHGSESSTSYWFLREVSPSYAVISVGKENQYGHPSENTIRKLQDADVNIIRTDLSGLVECVSDGEQVAFIIE